MAVENTIFAAGSSSSAGLHTVYTVPAGKLAVVRDWHFGTGGSAVGQISAGASRAGVLYTFYVKLPAPAVWVDDWRGRQVVEAGATLFVFQSDSHYVEWYASGYLVTLP